MTDQLIQALSTHQYLAAVCAALLILVSLGKLPAVRPQWERLPAWARPLVPIVLAMIAAVAQAIVSGTAWLPALVAGVVAGLPALLAALPSQVVHAPTLVVEGDSQHVIISRPTQTTKPE